MSFIITPRQQHVIVLPRYTAERYYVLSEIEIRSDIMSMENYHSESSVTFLDDDSMKSKVFWSSTVDFKAFYLLWDLRLPCKSPQGIIDTISAMLKTFNISNELQERCFLSIETIIPTGIEWEISQEKDLVDKAFSLILDTFDFGYFGFGVADNIKAHQHSLQSLIGSKQFSCHFVMSLEEVSRLEREI